MRKEPVGAESNSPPLTINEAVFALRVSWRWLQDFIKTLDESCWLQAGNHNAGHVRIIRQQLSATPANYSRHYITLTCNYLKYVLPFHYETQPSSWDTASKS